MSRAWEPASGTHGVHRRPWSPLELLLWGAMLLALPGENRSAPEQRCLLHVSRAQHRSGSPSPQFRRRDWREMQNGEKSDDEQQCKRIKHDTRSARVTCTTRHGHDPLAISLHQHARTSLRQLRGGSPDACRLHVKAADINCGQEGDIYVDVAQNCSVRVLKEAIAAQCNVSCSQQRLLFMGRELLNESAPLSDFRCVQTRNVLVCSVLRLLSWHLLPRRFVAISLPNTGRIHLPVRAAL